MFSPAARDRMKNFLIQCIRFYQSSLSPHLPPTCRFVPTCSEYTALAIQKNGAVKGLAMGFKRLIKCHPFNPGGYDPVK